MLTFRNVNINQIKVVFLTEFQFDIGIFQPMSIFKDNQHIHFQLRWKSTPLRIVTLLSWSPNMEKIGCKMSFLDVKHWKCAIQYTALKHTFSKTNTIYI